LSQVEPNATIAEIKTLLHKKYPKFYPSRQELKLHPGKLSHPSIIIVNLFYFIFYIYVFLAECLGPLFIYLLFYYRLPYIYMHEYDFTRSPFKVLACCCHSLHYIKRLVETILSIAFLTECYLYLCLYSWGFAAWQAYYIIHPLFTPPTYGRLQIYSALAMFLVWFRPAEIPYPTNNPFTWLFFFVSCPYEVGSWISFTVMTQCVPVGVFAFWGFIQMTIWARAKHKTYIEQFKDSPDLRTAIILLFF
uniref:Trans-2,3-enoyl-CoA reductase-like 2b n=1 Tax=Sinocyclocheilus grahami TaxID=75366 RepID=A0A672P8K3_SINGR